MPDGFHGDETLLTSHETPSFSLLVMSTKLMVFNVIKLSMKPPLRLALTLTQYIFDGVEMLSTRGGTGFRGKSHGRMVLLGGRSRMLCLVTPIVPCTPRTPVTDGPIERSTVSCIMFACSLMHVTAIGAPPPPSPRTLTRPMLLFTRRPSLLL